MRCEARPYEGSEPYIFVSYAHKDGEKVLPLLDHMQEDGLPYTPGTEYKILIVHSIEFHCRF